MNDLDLIKKLIRRHRRELTEIIGAFRARTPEQGWPAEMELVAGRDGAVYTVTVSRGNPGERDWLNVDAADGTIVACLE
jgi:hypothetical protein